MFDNFFARYSATVVWGQPALVHHLFPKPLSVQPSPNCTSRTKRASGPHQSRLKAGHSAESALLDVTEKRHTATTDPPSSSVVLLDLSAFPLFLTIGVPLAPKCKTSQWQRGRVIYGFFIFKIILSSALFLTLKILPTAASISFFLWILYCTWYIFVWVNCLTERIWLDQQPWFHFSYFRAQTICVPLSREHMPLHKLFLGESQQLSSQETILLTWPHILLH